MDLTLLRWTKNINREDGKWAYSYEDKLEEDAVFKLHWKPDSYNNAANAKKRDLAILRQKGRVTHIVEFIDNDKPKEDPENDNNWIYRLVKVIWMADNWSEPPYQKDVFDCSLNLQGGNIMKLENIKNLTEKWNTKGGIISFQKHVRQILKL